MPKASDTDTFVDYSLWNYDVCNDHEYGDHWNGENFSIYSVKRAKEDYLDHNDGKKHLYDGGRVLEAVLVSFRRHALYSSTD